jgi:hypothetical protein
MSRFGPPVAGYSNGMNPDEDPNPAAVYRAPMQARDRDAGQFEGARCGVSLGLVGIGDALDPPPETLDEAIAAAGATHGDKAGRMLLRFAELPDGTFVWTQTGDDEFRLGRISGPWRYEDSQCIHVVSIHHVRPADWLPDSFSVSETPLGVIDTFARGGRNL